MLRHWDHPFANDPDFRDQVLEAAVEWLKASVDGKVLMDGIPADEMNLVLAIWYAEWSSVQAGDDDEIPKRAHWLEAVRHAIPSCFCDQKDLG
jgi:hypothetical protein